ncbi:MAG: hypothetical protein HUU34_01805 [Saprospiraceae bacterium]|jgi:hypothetical protein|nr:hypothetical protein [Saprospiraceae bacterium]
MILTSTLTDLTGSGGQGEVLPEFVLRTDVVLGSPSAKCRGVGICRVVVAPRQYSGECPLVHAIIGLNANKRARFYFLKATISESIWKQHFQSGLFTVLEVFRLPHRLEKRLGLSSAFIHPGEYVIKTTPQYLMVDF